MTLQESFTAAEWYELKLAPLWILAAVGAADGKIDKAERSALRQGIDRCVGHADALVSELFGAVSDDFDGLWDRYMADERFAIHGVRAVGEVLSRTADPVQALHVKQTLVQLGTEVADASGGVLGVGAKRSATERKALHDVAEALRMSSRRLIAASRSNFDAILVPLDGSTEAEAALSMARTLADGFGSRVTLLHVVQEQWAVPAVAAEGYVAPPPIPSTAELSALGSAYLSTATSTYGSPEWAALCVVGDPADVIVDQARKTGVDLIVMATSGSSGLKRLFETKVTEDVCRKSDIPVLLVPVAGDDF